MVLITEMDKEQVGKEIKRSTLHHTKFDMLVDFHVWG